MSKVLVIGAGLAGLSSALMLQEAGHNVTIVARGMGGLLLSNGTVDILGWPEGSASTEPVIDLRTGLTEFAQSHPHHPYHAIGAENTFAGTAWLTQKLDFFDPVTPQEITENKFMPTAVGAVRPSALIPHSMEHSVLRDGMKLLVVGFRRLKDFPAELIADNLSRSPYVNVTARAITIDVPIREAKECDASSTSHARTFDSAEAQAERANLVAAIKAHVQEGETVLVPAMLGLNPATRDEICAQLDAPLGEIPLPPPSICGRRINDTLTQACKEVRIDIQLNAIATGYTAEGDKITGIKIQRAGRTTVMHPDYIVHAGGGFESGNLSRDTNLVIHESVFDLPLYRPEIPGKDFAAEGIFRAGVAANHDMNPVDENGKVLFHNLHLAGTVLGGALQWEEKSGEGIALGSAYALTQAIIRKESEAK